MIGCLQFEEQISQWWMSLSTNTSKLGKPKVQSSVCGQRSESPGQITDVNLRVQKPKNLESNIQGQ